jgi:hypothetical protein
MKRESAMHLTPMPQSIDDRNHDPPSSPNDSAPPN